MFIHFGETQGRKIPLRQRLVKQRMESSLSRRSERLNPSNMIAGGTFKKASVNIADGESSCYSPMCFLGDEDGFIEENTECDGDNEGKSFSRRTKKQKLLVDVEQETRKCRLSYRKLVVRERHRRVDDLSLVVIAACVDKKN